MSHRSFGARRFAGTLLLFLCTSLLVAACSDRKMEPARQAIADLDAAVAAAGTEPAEYIPDVLSDVNDQVGVLKARFGKEDYAAVLTAAPATLAAARALPRQAAARKADLHAMLRREWAILAAGVPTEIEAVRDRVDRLAGQKLAAGMTIARVDSARQGLDDARALWERAVTEQAAERPEQAVTLANQARDRTRGVAAMLGAPSPPHLK